MQSLFHSLVRSNTTRITTALLAILACRGVACGEASQQKPLSAVGWRVAFLGSQYDAAANVSVFFYLLSVAPWEQALSHWTLALGPGMAPAAEGHRTSYGLDPSTGMFGCKWDTPLPAGTIAFYGLTVPGNAPLAVTEYAVNGGTYFAIGETIGPASPPPPPQTWAIAGVLFVDANRNHTPEDDEPRLRNVSVDLGDASGQHLATVPSDAQGRYRFEGLADGNYLVQVPAATADSDANELVGAYLIPQHPLPRPVTFAGADSLENHAAYQVHVGAVLADFDASDPDENSFTFTGVGKSIGFWKHQCSVALSGKGNPQIDKATLLDYLHRVEALEPPEPFRFTVDREPAEALAILSITSSDAAARLCQQLLATELNHVAGLGLEGDWNPLQVLLIAWAKYVAQHPEDFTRDDLLAATDICDRINNLGH